jgi:peptidyl-prolyl cis-trans isomerase A (cyclophilin A)
MMKRIAKLGAGIALACGVVLAAEEQPTMATNAPVSNVTVVMSTSQGDIDIELFADKAPISVSNFLAYVEAGFFDGTIFHRVIPGFMAQGGGFTEKMQQKPTRAPIANEATNGLKNERGTLAMARTSDINSATAQFFINVKDNDFLNHGRDFGYAVFGRVSAGMDVVDKIVGVPTTTVGPFQNVPATPVVIKSAKRK